MEAAAEFGLAGLCGSSSDVGVVGYTLGGGMGSLGRKHGFAADHVPGRRDRHRRRPAAPDLRRLRARAVLGGPRRQGQLRHRDGAGDRAGAGAVAVRRRHLLRRRRRPRRCCTGFRQWAPTPAGGGQHLDRDPADAPTWRSCRRRCAGRPSSTCGSPTPATTTPRPSACSSPMKAAGTILLGYVGPMRTDEMDAHPHGPGRPDAGLGEGHAARRPAPRRRSTRCSPRPARSSRSR